MQEQAVCGNCEGSGMVFKDKDRCKKCKGKRVVQTRKMLELYIPRGSRQGDKIVLQGEADQSPDQEPGDIIFELLEVPHEKFRRAGADLAADIHVTLAEALTGFNRVVLTHLDGRGIQIQPPKGSVLRPDQILRVEGEGMYMKKSDARGDLFLTVNIDFPKDGWTQDPASIASLRKILPAPEAPIKAEMVDEVEYDADATIDEFGAGSDDPRGGAEWEDDDDDEQGGPQCAQQ
jgi:DnaJ family protein A protein 2